MRALCQKVPEQSTSKFQDGSKMTLREARRVQHGRRRGSDEDPKWAEMGVFGHSVQKCPYRHGEESVQNGSNRGEHEVPKCPKMAVYGHSANKCPYSSHRSSMMAPR